MADETRPAVPGPGRGPGPQGDIETIPAQTHAERTGAPREERFTPGTLLAGRYRIVSRLGRGGMGEVYRADDLKLGQGVALKFLPQALATDARWLKRFHDEVRIAREIAHPNVCRVYDIGELDGEHYISMEYIDGEDLAILLRRIGRLPKDKAIQIARQLCAGLAAAHDRGVLHRDLKPANIMLDGRGHARITDFGIAALADEMSGRDAREIRAGTPMYMAPEQLAGTEVTVRSDVYTLGLVLYELFTGRVPFDAESLPELQRLRESSVPSDPSSHIEDMDPAVERVILRCLERDPKHRPQSVAAVAAALPGGDPLAMALAAGETPSPEMVAAAGERGATPPRIVMAAVAVILALLVGVVALVGNQKSIVQGTPTKPPEVLVDRVRAAIALIPDAPAPVDEIWGLREEREMQEWRRQEDNLAANPAEPAIMDPSALPPLYGLWYRGSAHWLVADVDGRRPNFSDPSHRHPGDVQAIVDGIGRLRSLEVEPLTGWHAPTDDAREAFDWSPLLRSAGLVPEQLDVIGPSGDESTTWTPPGPADRTLSWRGVDPEYPHLEVRVDAAELAGRPVALAVRMPWHEHRTRDLEGRPDILQGVIAFVLGTALVLAFRNLRTGRGDRRGAGRLAAVVLLAGAVTYLASAHHVVHIDEFGMILAATLNLIGFGALVWLMYLAVEPIVRRTWPQCLVAWTRLINGRMRDPLVGRDVLLGIGIGLLLEILFAVVLQENSASVNVELYLGPRHLLSVLLGSGLAAVVGLGFFVLVSVVRRLVRRLWLAFLVTVVVLPITAYLETGDLRLCCGILLFLSILFGSLVRFGFLTFGTATLVASSTGQVAITSHVGEWFAAPGLAVGAGFLALTAWSAWVALGGQPLFREET